MNRSFLKRTVALIVAVLLIVGMSPVTFAEKKESKSGKITIEKPKVKLAVGESVTLSVEYTDFSEEKDISRARVDCDKVNIVDAEFGWNGSDLESIVLTGLKDGETTVFVTAGGIWGQCIVTVGQGNKTPEQVKKEEAATKAAQDVLTNDNSELGAALAEAIGKSTKKEVIVSTTSAKTPSISAATMKALAARASQAKKNVFIRLDSLDSNGKLQAQMLLNPEGLTNLKADFKTGITVDTSRKASLGSKYIASVKCAHTGSLGMFTEIGVKVSVPKDVSQLALYNVDSKGKLIRIEEPGCSVDKNGLLRFYTKAGGEIVIMNG